MGGEDNGRRVHPYEVEDDDNGEEVGTWNQDRSHPAAWDNGDGETVNQLSFHCVEVESLPNSLILALNSLEVVHPQQLSCYHLEAWPALDSRAHQNEEGMVASYTQRVDLLFDSFYSWSSSFLFVPPMNHFLSRNPSWMVLRDVSRSHFPL